MRCLAVVLGAVLLVAQPSVAHAQQAAGEFARMVVLKPRPDQAAKFAAGYERHLDWHKRNQDPWTWHGWTFVLGERMGQFMDGTFGHAIEDFDQAIHPAEDAADNNLNVAPYADFVSHGIYERVAAASVGAPLPDTTPFMAMTTYTVVPGRESAFEAAIASAARRLSGQRMSWYRLRIGGPLSQYVLMRPAGSFAAGGALPRFDLPEGLVQRGDSELLRYQPTLSYRP